MQSYILRCKHCQREYRTSEEGASMEYCPECQKAIDKALADIPVKFVEKEMEIVEPMLFPLFEKIKTTIEERQKNDEIVWPVVMGVFGDAFGNYDNIDVFYHMNKKYLVKYNDDTPEDKHVFVSMVYDVLNKEYTKKPWRYERNGDEYCHYRNTAKDLTRTLTEMIDERPMDTPKGDLFYMNDLEWTLHDTSLKDRPVDRTQKPHVLKTRTTESEGWHIKLFPECGWYKTTVKVADGIDIESLIDFVDYKYTYEQYEDEDIATIIKIEAV